MLPRRASLSRFVGISLLFSFCFWIWINNDQTGSVTRTWDDVIKDTEGDDAKGQFQANRIITELKQTHHHSNLSLEEFRDNMTLGGVNMSGLLDLIKSANDSVKQTIIHNTHINVPNPHPFKYLINAPNVCKNKNMFLIIYIHTAPSHYKRRMVIRQTWGNPKFYPDVKVRLIFVMGKGANASEAGAVQDGLEFENEQYHDIVQEDFMDTYRNLTYKGIAALKWISSYCSHAKFVLKTDDDIFVNMFTLLKHLQSMDRLGVENHGLIMCLVWNRMKVMRTGKWKVGENEWKDDYYPTYCSGSAFTFSTDVAIKLHEVSYHVPFFWVDDFYVTGLLPLKVGNITHKQFMSTYVLDGRKLEEKFTGPQWFTYIFSHVHNLDMIQTVWDRLVGLAAGRENPAVKFALPGQLPDEAELRRKEQEEEKRKAEEKKKKDDAEKAKKKRAEEENAKKAVEAAKKS